MAWRPANLATGEVMTAARMQQWTDVIKAKTVDTTAVTVANTTTDSLLKGFTISANDLAVGNVIRITASGNWGTANATDFVTLRFRIGSVTVTTVAAPRGSTTADHWRFDWLIYITAIGSSGTFNSEIGTQFRNGTILTDADGRLATESRSFTGTAIDTTISRVVDILAQWSAANASNTITIRNFLVEFVN